MSWLRISRLILWGPISAPSRNSWSRCSAVTSSTSARDEATKNVRLQDRLLQLHEDFGVIGKLGLIYFNWDPRFTAGWYRGVVKNKSKTAVVKKKHALRCLRGQERFLLWIGGIPDPRVEWSRGNLSGSI